MHMARGRSWYGIPRTTFYPTLGGSTYLSPAIEHLQITPTGQTALLNLVPINDKAWGVWVCLVTSPF